MCRSNPYEYPVGKKRMQPLGILVFASVVAVGGVQIILEALCALMLNENKLDPNELLEQWFLGIMILLNVVKLLLIVFRPSSSNEMDKISAKSENFGAVANVFSLVAVFLAKYLGDWVDAAGAILLALFTIRTWSMAVLENINSLVGKSAPPDYLQRLTYLCWNHHEAIEHIDTVRAYTFGYNYFVEVDIVLPRDTPLSMAHDIGESLQEKLELLPEIERAFVYIDYEFCHRPEHVNFSHEPV